MEFDPVVKFDYFKKKKKRILHQKLAGKILSICGYLHILCLLGRIF